MFQIAKASTPSGYPRQAAAREVRKGTKTLRQVPTPGIILLLFPRKPHHRQSSFVFSILRSVLEQRLAVASLHRLKWVPLNFVPYGPPDERASAHVIACVLSSCRPFKRKPMRPRPPCALHATPSCGKFAARCGLSAWLHDRRCFCPPPTPRTCGCTAHDAQDPGFLVAIQMH